jgi:hypothetical protein
MHIENSDESKRFYKSSIRWEKCLSFINIWNEFNSKENSWLKESKLIFLIKIVSS